MKDISSVETLVIPADVTVAIKARKVTVTGPRGTLQKNVGHVQMDIQIVSLAKPAPDWKEKGFWHGTRGSVWEQRQCTARESPRRREEDRLSTCRARECGEEGLQNGARIGP